ncbi:hypothetical protein A0H81_11213 [Grifola frondosa]|uniref:2-dehydropantoate 2-reductase n=1 Tax=Grifola frondosa TaxID=5627 RepID=A0A1C7LYE3_GRIFR|nr:hypothetical protein A0H81_11213 [Grifola frondosa]
MAEAEIVDICVVGFGGVSCAPMFGLVLTLETSPVAAIGAIYALALDRSQRVRITAVCRSNYDIVREHGIDFVSDGFGTHSAWKPYRVVRTVADAADRSYAYVVCAFKCLPDITTTPALLAPLLTPLLANEFVLLQNGIGIEDDLLAALPVPVPVLSGCAWVDATTVDGGRKVTQFGNERLVIGAHHPPSSSPAPARAALDNFCALLRAGGAAPEATDDIDAARWRKVLWNASFSTICTLTRADVGAVLATPSARAALADIMEEVLRVAAAALRMPPRRRSAGGHHRAREPRVGVPPVDARRPRGAPPHGGRGDRGRRAAARARARRADAALGSGVCGAGGDAERAVAGAARGMRTAGQIPA